MGAPLPFHIMSETSKEELIALWRALCDDPLIAALPYKVETNERGQLLMSPARTTHSIQQARIAYLFASIAERKGIAGDAATESAVLTAGGIKVPDVAWLTPEDRHGSTTETLLTAAPAVCVEVLSPSNSAAEIAEKVTLYFAAGAREVWVCEEDGTMRFQVGGAAAQASAMFPEFPARIGDRA
jgi:Uma2 family endonuclease